MSSTEQDQKFEWPTSSREETRFWTQAGSVFLKVFRRKGRDDGYPLWKFEVSPCHPKTNFSPSTTLKLEVEGYCYTSEEAKAEAEMFGYRMQKVVSVLYEPLPAPAPPKVGDEIYVPTIFDDEDGSVLQLGGKARIKEATLERPQFDLCWLVTVEELQFNKFNYEDLLEQQKKLSAEFGDQRASANPIIMEQKV